MNTFPSPVPKFLPLYMCVCWRVERVVKVISLVNISSMYTHGLQDKITPSSPDPQMGTGACRQSCRGKLTQQEGTSSRFPASCTGCSGASFPSRAPWGLILSLALPHSPLGRFETTWLPHPSTPEALLPWVGGSLSDQNEGHLSRARQSRSLRVREAARCWSKSGSLASWVTPTQLFEEQMRPPGE